MITKNNKNIKIICTILVTVGIIILTILFIITTIQDGKELNKQNAIDNCLKEAEKIAEKQLNIRTKANMNYLGVINGVETYQIEFDMEYVNPDTYGYLAYVVDDLQNCGVYVDYADVVTQILITCGGKEFYINGEDLYCDGDIVLSNYEPLNISVDLDRRYNKYEDFANTSSDSISYDATLSYGSGGVLIFVSEEAMERYMTALSQDNKGTLDEMIANGEVSYTEKETKCNIVERKLTKYKVNLLDGSYAGNTVWVIVEAVHEE